jgi:hypothetical protein
VNVTVFVGIISILLFGASFVTRRRYGVLGLALAAGATLSALWTAELTPLLQRSGVEVTVAPLDIVVAVGLVLLPAILLLISGPTYQKPHGRLFGSLLFALLALAFSIEALGPLLVLEGWEQNVYDFITTNRTLIVTAGLGIAIFDLLTTKAPKVHTDKGKH